MSTSQNFHLLARGIQRFIWDQQWQDLKDIQEQAIGAVLADDRDVIISASTASGKTEAAFFPLLTQLLDQESAHKLLVYISPLKALINDQFSRLTLMCDALGIEVHPWHGDIGQNRKQKFLKDPSGVLLITPEALEATLCLRGNQVGQVFAQCGAVVVDEMHSFIGNERGKQLQSLMWRMERATNQRIRRIGLSATLGDMQDAKSFLRSGAASEQVHVLVSTSDQNRMAVLVKGFEEPRVLKNDQGDEQTLPGKNSKPLQIDLDQDPSKELTLPEEDPSPEKTAVSPGHIAKYLFDKLRGTNNLIFPNSRHGVEQYTHQLNKLCKASGVRQEFWPHHGSLSKDIRSHTEEELKQKDRSATGVCTNTLEMGIDIGTTKSVAQIGSPIMVSALRQRAGRSGRREGEPSILRCFVIEDELTGDNSLCSMLRTETLQMVAMVHLLLKRWNEPTVSTNLHLSTFVQQALSLICQYHSLTPSKLYVLMCSPGAPFENVEREDFKSLLIHLKLVDLIFQDDAGYLMISPKGEKVTGHYSFYATFATTEEFRVLADGKSLGTMPVNSAMTVGQNILFSGRTWRVTVIDEAAKFIGVVRASGGKPPVFTGARGYVHHKVRETMRALARGQIETPFLDETAQKFLRESQDTYKTFDLDNVAVISQGLSWHVTTWLGDSANEALVFMLKSLDIRAWGTDIGLEFEKTDRTQNPAEVFSSLLKVNTNPESLLREALNLATEKWDWALPDHLLKKSYVQARIDLPAAKAWLEAMRPQIEQAMALSQAQEAEQAQA